MEAKTDFLLFHNIFRWMQEGNLNAFQAALLLQLLVNLCLQVFRKNVFTSLGEWHIQQPLHPARLEVGCRGDIPLTLKGVK